MGLFMNKKNGFTLVELIIAIAIIGVALMAILGVFRVSINNSANPVTRKQAVLISESLMEEVLSKAFVKPSGGYAGPFTVATRQSFDTVTDYNNLTINGISNVYGTSIAGLENYNVTITVQNQAIGAIPNTDAYLATINVVGPNDNFTLKGYRINYEN